jgi:hypothetical protein
LTSKSRDEHLEIIQLSGIYAAVQRAPDGKTVFCTGIVTFNPRGRLLAEFSGGELTWTTSKQRDGEIKTRVKKYIQGDLEKTAGVRYAVSNDRIFLVDKQTYRRVLKKARVGYAKWLESRQ